MAGNYALFISVSAAPLIAPDKIVSQRILNEKKITHLDSSGQTSEDTVMLNSHLVLRFEVLSKVAPMLEDPKNPTIP